ncbi:uncharacterized protein LOC106532132, partial [Austrofundulus limnaeus]|uniref:Uncharacterized protein LOC106532132 n=1 Tax=Austrofundulus limnaeus TaxID=52670 RepID=A0A2I4CUD8_AUSLI
MEAGTVCSRKRPCGRAELHLHQEACRRSSREEEEEERAMKRRRRTGRGRKENRDPGEDPLQTRTTKDQRRISQTRTRTRTTPVRSGLRSGVQLQVCRPEIKTALIRKTRSQNLILIKGSEALILTDQSDPGLTRTTGKVRSRSTMKLPTETNRSSDRTLGPEPCKPEPGQQRTTAGSGVRTRVRKKRKVHPSAFRGRGQLRLSITAEAGQLIIHIHEARGLMGKSWRSCDSYVKLTSDLDHSIRRKTRAVPNTKNPTYEQNFTLCITERLLLSRLLFSVFRRLPDSRCSQLIGCMSFGIGSLVSSSQQVTGWFYLLAEEYGRSKHLRVTSQRSRPIKRPQEEVGQKEAGQKEAASGADLRRTPA